MHYKRKLLGFFTTVYVVIFGSVLAYQHYGGLAPLIIATVINLGAAVACWSEVKRETDARVQTMLSNFCPMCIHTIDKHDATGCTAQVERSSYDYILATEPLSPTVPCPCGWDGNRKHEANFKKGVIK